MSSTSTGSARWFLGRRIWLTLGLMFHGNLQMLMNIGMFPPIMMSTYLFCLQGDEPGRIVRFFGRGLARLGVPMPASVRNGEPPPAGRGPDPRAPPPRRPQAAGRARSTG
jgi:hypothetical protein